MSLEWMREENARWNDDKKRIIGTAPAGVFDQRFKDLADDDSLPGDWWRVEKDGETVAYGWLDLVWGDAEIVLATDPGCRDQGIGSFTLEKIESECRTMGVNYVYNTVRPTHPDREKVTSWLEKRGFVASEDGALRLALAKAKA